MDIFDAIKGRKSIRSFKSTPVEEEKIKNILEAAILAPSAGNTQPWHFIVVRDKKIKDALSVAALEQESLVEAPVVIVVCADTQKSFNTYAERGKNLYCIQDCANATIILMLTAHSLGLGTVWVGAFNEGDVQKILSIPKHIRPMAIIPVGYASETQPRTPTRRNPLESVLHNEEF